MNPSEEMFRKLCFESDSEYLAFTRTYDVRVVASTEDLSMWFSRVSVHNQDGSLAYFPDKPNLIYYYEGWEVCDLDGKVVETVPDGVRACWFQRAKVTKSRRMHAGMNLDEYELHRYVRHGPALYEVALPNGVTTERYWVRGKKVDPPKTKR
jgi:hypothetical protein